MRHSFLMFLFAPDAADKGGAILVVKAVNDKLPENLKVLHLGEITVTDPKEQIEVLRGYIRSSVLKQFGIVSVNRNNVSVAPIGFNDNNVQTRLKLPKPHQRLNGDWNESLENYWKRVMPTVQLWLRNSLFNSNVSEAVLKAMD